ncbi:hypothetical protein [Blastococcus sp. SYSU D00820]
MTATPVRPAAAGRHRAPDLLGDSDWAAAADFEAAWRRTGRHAAREEGSRGRHAAPEDWETSPVRHADGDPFDWLGFSETP